MTKLKDLIIRNKAFLAFLLSFLCFIFICISLSKISHLLHIKTYIKYDQEYCYIESNRYYDEERCSNGHFTFFAISLFIFSIAISYRIYKIILKINLSKKEVMDWYIWLFGSIFFGFNELFIDYFVHQLSLISDNSIYQYLLDKMWITEVIIVLFGIIFLRMAIVNYIVFNIEYSPYDVYYNLDNNCYNSKRSKRNLFKRILDNIIIFILRATGYKQQLKIQNLCDKFLSNFYDNFGNKLKQNSYQDQYDTFQILFIKINDLSKKIKNKDYSFEYSSKLQSFIYNFYKENGMNFDKLVQKMHNLKESEKSEINTISFIFKDIKEFIENQQL